MSTGEIGGVTWTTTREECGAWYGWVEAEFVGAFLSQAEAEREAQLAAKCRARGGRWSA